MPLKFKVDVGTPAPSPTATLVETLFGPDELQSPTPVVETPPRALIVAFQVAYRTWQRAYEAESKEGMLRDELKVRAEKGRVYCAGLGSRNDDPARGARTLLRQLESQLATSDLHLTAQLEGATQRALVRLESAEDALRAAAGIGKDSEGVYLPSYACPECGIVVTPETAKAHEASCSWQPRYEITL